MPDCSNPMANEEKENILRELCTCNGLSHSQIENDGPATNKLEMFFSGYPTMEGLNHFVNLQTLVLVGQPIDKIENLHFCPELKELWVCECRLKSIHGLEKNWRLEKLYLYNNEISVIENLEHLVSLQTFNVSKNQITSLEGCGKLKSLTDLNLAGNKIRSVGNHLEPLENLHTLNLSGNNLSSFKDITNLKTLPQLKDLSLKDSLYPNNPVCLLCNYSTHILYHLPSLERLDSFDVTSLQLKDLAVATVTKKLMYYNMKVKTVLRSLTTFKNTLTREKRSLLLVPEKRLKAVSFALKSIQQQLQSNKSKNGSDSEAKNATISKADKDAGDGLDEEVEDGTADGLEMVSNEQIETKMSALDERIEAWKKKLEEIEVYFKQAMDMMTNLANVATKRLLVELETGGNVRYEQGRSSNIWYSTCHDLVLSRFCAWDYKVHNVTGIKIHGITRVHNRILRGRFDDKVHAINSDENFSSSNKNYKKLVDYLFYIWNPKAPNAKSVLHRILETGFNEDEMLLDGVVPLSNSLFISEKPRIDHTVSEVKDQQYPDPCPFRYGQVVVAKVYLGKSAPAQPIGKITADRYANCNSVYRPRKESSNHNQNHSTKDCECSARQCEWFMFDRDLVLPEYVIDFEYFAKRAASPFQAHVSDWLSSAVSSSNHVGTASLNNDSTLFQDEEALDMDAANLPPLVKPRPRLVSLSEDIFLTSAKVTTISQITVLNLHGNGLSKLKGINTLTQLRSLTVSFNDLTRLDDIAHLPCLETVDATFNKINSLEGMRGMSKLKNLDISWNQLTSLRDDLTVLRKHSPNLNTLNLRNNPWIKVEYLFLRVIGRLKSLTLLNGTNVTESDAAAALRLNAGTRITPTSLSNQSRTDGERINSLNLSSQAQVLCITSKLKPDMKDPNWMKTVTTLNLDGHFIGKFTGLESLANLRWASFNKNCITKLEGIELCSHLEELSIQDNCLYKLDGLVKLTKLRRLDLSGNYLSALEAGHLDKLQHLVYLSLENNKISTFKELSKVRPVVELYLGNNKVSSIREIFHLKSLPNLLILDMYGNPVVQSENYRLFIIYHLNSLKALDGVAIEANEEGSAKDAFGGRLTNDFVAERIGHSNFNEVRELEFPNCSVRTVDIGGGDVFKNLKSVNLEHNSLSSFSGLVHLRHLRVLCLNHNHIDCVVPKPRNHQKQQIRSTYAMNYQNNDMAMSEPLTPLMESLEVLHLGYNKICNMAALQLGRLVNLKALFIQGNEICKVEGLAGLHELRELVLDRNKIKCIQDTAFQNVWNLQELHLEENRIRDLSNLHHLENLQRLYLGMNRIQDMMELEKLEALPNLLEVSVIGNAVSRRLLHRPMLVFQQPNLQTIDGITVTPEERDKAELYFMDQQPITTDSVLPGITPHNRAGPIKVTHMAIGSDRYPNINYPPSHEENTQNKHRRVKDRHTEHSGLTHSALYNQLAGIKYQQHNHGYISTKPFNNHKSNHGSRGSHNSGNKYK